jgi:hypothetical protein
MKQTLNTQHSTLNVELTFSELNLGRWTLGVGRF